MPVEIGEVNEMNLEQMQKLEDQLVAEEAGVIPAVAPVPAEPKPGEPPATVVPPAAVPPVEPSPAPAATPPPADDLTKHISPPSKWAAERHEKRQLQRDLEETKAKAEKAEVLEGELGKLRADFDFLKTAITQGGIKMPNNPANPAEAFTPEKIEEIRNEFGDELADMMVAASAILKTQVVPPTPASQAQPPPAPAPAAVPPPATQVDPNLLKAIDDNDELSYWQEHSPALWQRAVAKDAEMLSDKSYASLSYQDRFAKVVESVKNDVVTGATGKPPAGQQDGDLPPTSLTGAPGVGSQTNNSVLSQFESIADQAKQIAFYNALPVAKRDEIDKALGI